MTPYNIYPIKNMEKCIIFVVFYLAFTQQLSFESLFCCAREGQAEQLVAKIQGREGDTEMVERIILSVIRIQPGSYLRKLGWYWELYFFSKQALLRFSSMSFHFIHSFYTQHFELSMKPSAKILDSSPFQNIVLHFAFEVFQFCISTSISDKSYSYSLDSTFLCS